jgi:uncharacterized protein (UPF0332 family)
MMAVADSRIRFARSLRELADRSSEAEMRNALSRSYYSIYHAAKVLSPKIDHHNIAEELGRFDQQVGLDIEILQKLRSQADYDPRFVEREFEGSLELFRIQVQERVEQGRRIFRWLMDEIGRNQ